MNSPMPAESGYATGIDSSDLIGARTTFQDVRRRRWTLLLMCVATFMIQLDVTVVNVALPQIQNGLGMGADGLEWVIGAYALSLAALIPVGGALGDRYGRKRVVVAGMAIFTLGSIACALSPTAALLIAARAVQGIGGAAMLALTLSIVTDAFQATRARAIGTWAAVGGSGFGVGPAVGGVLLTSFGWQSVFWLNVPFGVVGIVGTTVVVRESRHQAVRSLDLLGVLLCSAGLVGTTLGLVQAGYRAWVSPIVLVPLAVGVVLLAAFAYWQRRAPNAMLPPQLRRARSAVIAATIYLISYAAFSAALFYVSLFYQGVAGWSVLRTGLSWLIMNVPFLSMAQLADRLEQRLVPGAGVVGGCVVGAAGIAVLASVSPATPFALTATGYLLSGAGFGMMVPSLTHLGMRDVPAEVSGVASAVLNASRQVGTSIGLAVFGAFGVGATMAAWRARTARFPAVVRVMAEHQAQRVAGARIALVTRALGPAYRGPAALSFTHGYHVAVGCAAGCLALAAVVAIIGLRQPLRGPVGKQPHGRHQFRVTAG